MKKHKLLKWAILIIVFDIATICIISSIYIDFVKTSTTKVASIEKWGVRITAPAKIMSKSYASDDGNSVTAYTRSELGDLIIEPGSVINLGHFTITGLSQDSAAIKCSSNIKFNNWYIDENDSKEYCPIVFVIGNDEYMLSSMLVYMSEPAIDTDQSATTLHTYSTINELEEGVETAIKSMYETKGTYQTSNGNWIRDYQDVTWKWDWYDNNLTDEYDTILGSREQTPTINVAITLTIEWDDTSESAGGSDNASDTADSSTSSSQTATATQPTTTNPTDTISGIVETQPSPDTIEDSFLDGKVKTGDTFNIIIWISLMVVSATVIILMLIILIAKRRNSQDRGHNDENK